MSIGGQPMGRSDHLYRQDRAEDIDAITKMYTLDPGSAGSLPNLGIGHHLLKIGNRREIHVEHVRSQLERGLTNTDAEMVFVPESDTLAAVGS